MTGTSETGTTGGSTLAALRLLDENRLQPGLVGGLTMGAAVIELRRRSARRNRR
jgi:hypothetical protein